MAKTNFQTIDEYIGTFPKSVRVILENLRRTIRNTIPGAEETISYQIPTFKLQGNYVVYFAAWKRHISLYPVPKGNEAFKKALSQYQTGKGTLRFSLEKPLPLRLIQKIVKYRVNESLEREKKKKY